MSFGSGFSGESGHYVHGVEGIKAATLPPPGFYYRLYTVYYDADQYMDQDGNEYSFDFDVTLFALVNRFIWVTDYKILGGNYFMDVIIPLLNTDLKHGALGFDDSKFGVSDIAIEPFGISWHGAVRYFLARIPLRCFGWSGCLCSDRRIRQNQSGVSGQGLLDRHVYPGGNLLF
jgi:hypothetical protein